jgi:putative membrane protein
LWSLNFKEGGIKMGKLLLKWLVNCVALFVVVHIFHGITATSLSSIIVAALILGLLNAFLKPILVILTLPINILTLGFFTLIINAVIFLLAAKFVQGFTVIGFANAFWAALLFSIVSFLLNLMINPED